MTKRLMKKLKKGIKDEKEGIDYYKSFTPKEKKELSKQERKNILDAEKDEKEHLRYLEKDKETIGRMR